MIEDKPLDKITSYEIAKASKNMASEPRYYQMRGNSHSERLRGIMGGAYYD